MRRATSVTSARSRRSRRAPVKAVTVKAAALARVALARTPARAALARLAPVRAAPANPIRRPPRRAATGGAVTSAAGGASNGAGRRIANEKRKERDKRRRAIARRRTAAAVLLAVAIGLGCWGIVALWNSSLFAVQNVEVSGVERLTAESIAASASIPADATLLNLSTREVRKNILGEPWVADVKVGRGFPHTVKIAVTERTSALAVQTSESAIWLVSADDYWLEAHSIEETFSVPFISDIAGLNPEAGKSTGSAEIKNALALVDGLSDELKGRLQKISAPSVDGTLLVLNGPIEVYMGSADDVETKDRIARGILGEQKDVVYINVRIVDRPTWRGLKE
ncbi:MAG: cell division protein FtsQ/DivIB [Coriobacteriia bacterium]